jgi:hypothetical protein
MKRFIETSIFKKRWFSKLSQTQKLSWVYIICECDSVGVYEINESLETAFIGEQIDFETLIKNSGDNLEQINQDKILITNFLNIQYADSIFDKTVSSAPIISHRKNILKHGIFDMTRKYLKEIGNKEYYNSLATLDQEFTTSSNDKKKQGLTKGIRTLKEKEKEKEKETVKEREEVKDKANVQANIDEKLKTFKSTWKQSFSENEFNEMIFDNKIRGDMLDIINALSVDEIKQSIINFSKCVDSENHPFVRYKTPINFIEKMDEYIDSADPWNNKSNIKTGKKSEKFEFQHDSEFDLPNNTELSQEEIEEVEW